MENNSYLNLSPYFDSVYRLLVLIRLQSFLPDASPIVSRYCGDTLPLKFTSSKNFLRVEFYSDKAIVDKGFTLDYEYLPPAGERQYKGNI